MARQPITTRRATRDDVPFLLELWHDRLRRGEERDQLRDVEAILTEASDSSDRRLIIAEAAGEPVGAVLLQLTTLSPLDLEPVVRAAALHVTPSRRGTGVGCVLMEAAVLWAEELGVGYIATNAPSSSRTANRFMARLAIGPRAVMRIGTTHGVRARLVALQPQRGGSDRLAPRRHLGQVLAVRRQLVRRAAEDTGAA